MGIRVYRGGLVSEQHFQFGILQLLGAHVALPHRVVEPLGKSYVL